jgi:hypothetical protein
VTDDDATGGALGGATVCVQPDLAEANATTAIRAVDAQYLADCRTIVEAQRLLVHATQRNVPPNCLLYEEQQIIERAHLPTWR